VWDVVAGAMLSTALAKLPNVAELAKVGTSHVVSLFKNRDMHSC
jgi:hypothetical protein